MKIEYMKREGIGVVKIWGRLDGQDADRLKEAVPQYLQKTANILIDCEHLEYIDSGGLGALLASLKKAVAAGGDIRLASVQPKVKMTLELTRADQIFTSYGSVGTGVESWVQ